MKHLAGAAGRIADILATTSSPWSSVYAHNRAVSTAVIFFHVAPLVFGAGAAFVMDRATLRASRGGPIERYRHLHELKRVHRVVLTGLTFLLTRTEHALLTTSNNDALWQRMRTLSVVSAVLWLATTFSGVVLTQFS
jgi:hypothetical protein